MPQAPAKDRRTLPEAQLNERVRWSAEPLQVERSVVPWTSVCKTSRDSYVSRPHYTREDTFELCIHT